MSFRFQHREEKGVLILSLQGNLDASQTLSFKKDLSLFLQKDSPRILLDCSQLEFVDSTGLGSLISVLRKVEAKGGKLGFAALSAEVASIFEITRLHKLFQIFPNISSAVQSLAQ